MQESQIAIRDPHRGQPVLTAGASLSEARLAVLMIHGRGASAEDILGLATELDLAGCAYLAPQAAGNTWYPNRFLVPLTENEPWLSSALGLMESVLARIAAGGLPPERTVLLGFSQGACLTLEFAARHARRYAGLVGLSGALIGPDETPREYAGSLDGTPVFLGCSDIDPYVPKERVDAAAENLRRLGGQVTERIYPGMAHTVSPEEIDFVRGMLQAVPAGKPKRGSS